MNGFHFKKLFLRLHQFNKFIELSYYSESSSVTVCKTEVQQRVDRRDFLVFISSTYLVLLVDTSYWSSCDGTSISKAVEVSVPSTYKPPNLIAVAMSRRQVKRLIELRIESVKEQISPRKKISETVSDSSESCNERANLNLNGGKYFGSIFGAARLLADSDDQNSFSDNQSGDETDKESPWCCEDNSRPTSIQTDSINDYSLEKLDFDTASNSKSDVLNRNGSNNILSRTETQIEHNKETQTACSSPRGIDTERKYQSQTSFQRDEGIDNKSNMDTPNSRKNVSVVDRSDDELSIGAPMQFPTKYPLIFIDRDGFRLSSLRTNQRQGSQPLQQGRRSAIQPRGKMSRGSNLAKRYWLLPLAVRNFTLIRHERCILTVSLNNTNSSF